MPRKKTTTVTEDLPEFDVNTPGQLASTVFPKQEADPEITTYAPVDMEEVQAFMQNFGAEPISVKVYRKTNRGNEFCFKCSGSEIDESLIQDNCGGGEFILRMYVNGVKQPDISMLIGQPQQPRSTAANHGTGYSVEGRGTGHDSSDVLREELRDTREMLHTLMLKQSHGTPISEIAEAMKTFASMIPQQQQNQSSASDKAIEMLIKGLELGRGADAADWKTELLRTVKDVAAPVVTGLVQEYRANRNGNGAMLNPNADTQERTEMNQQQMVMQGIAYLKQKALSNMPVELVADWIINSANEPAYQSFIKTVIGVEFSEFVKLDADLSRPPLNGWFQNLHSMLRQAYTQNSVEEPEVEPGAEEDEEEPPVTEIPPSGKLKAGKAKVK